MKLSTNGQKLEFTMKSPVPLAAGQHVVWEEKTKALSFNIAAAPAASSVQCKCGTKTWDTTFTKPSNDRLQLLLPASGSTTTDVVCAAGDLSCTARAWNTGSTKVAEMDVVCFGCQKSKSTCAKGTAAEQTAQYNDAATYKLKQQATADTTKVKLVSNVQYEPHSKTAVGRFYFKPSTTASLYAGFSVFEFTFGAQTFGTTAVCSVWTVDGTKPSKTPSDAVKNCEVTGSTVKLTLAKASSSFFVTVVGMDAWLASTTNDVSVTLKNFGADTAKTSDTAADQFQMPTTANTPTATMTVAVTKSLINVMDVGMVQFAITPKGADFGPDSLAFISFPTYYNPTIGSMMRCTMYDATKKTDTRLYCAVEWCYTLKVMGPSTPAKKDAAFNLRVYGVDMNSYGAALKFGVGLTNATYWASNKGVNEYITVADVATSGKWAAVSPIEVSEVSLSSQVMRSKADITVKFALPPTTGTVLNDGDYVALTLPW
jgi:hypothetical protein